jgi:glucose/arabinose dehydrogenase
MLNNSLRAAILVPLMNIYRVQVMRAAWLCAIVSLLSPPAALAQLATERVAGGFAFPVAVVQDPTQPNVQFVVEQGGRIRVLCDGQLQSVDFLDLTPLVLSGGERGLLGLAFAPDYAVSRRFFVNYTRQPDGHTVIARYRRSAADSLRADASSRFDLQWPNGNRFITQPFANHNGGDLKFGSDGYLYIPLGDGGSANDPDHRAQNPAELLGKILRIDTAVLDTDVEGYDVPLDNPFVGQPGVLPAIWAFGVRNPFRATVDLIARGGTGALIFADVGQNAWEEIDYEPFGAGGRNYGWRNREGAHDNVTSRPPAFLPLVDPIAEYSHAVGNVITGGVVYRGGALGIAFFGRYFFADFGASRIWSMGLTIDPMTREAQAGQILEHTSELGGASVIGNVSAFGVGADCEVYFLNWSAGELRRIVGGPGTAPGCPTSPDPFLASGGGVFTDGRWFSRDDPRVAGAGLGGASGTAGCTTPRPVSNWLCINGGWVPPNHPLAGTAGGAGGSTGGGTTGGGTGGGTGTTDGACVTQRPVSTWLCVNGGWVPPDHPLASGSGQSNGGGSGGTPGGGTGGSTGGTPGGCTTLQPASSWVCVNGGWVPPNHPLARGGD